MVVVHIFNPSTQETEAGGSLWVQGQPGLQSELLDSQGYAEKSCPRKQKQKQKKKKVMITSPSLCTSLTQGMK